MEKNYIFGHDDLPQFDSGMGVGLKFKYKDFEYTALIPSTRQIRKVHLCLSSWGKHIYAKMRVWDLEMHKEGTPLMHTTSVPDEYKPLETRGFVIELRHILLKEEVDICPQDWECYEVGNWTSRFSSLDEVKELAKEIFEKHFKGNWKMERL